MKKCLSCGKEVKNKFCNVTCQNLYQSEAKNNKIYGEFKDFEVCCLRCDNKFLVNEREKLFPKKEKYFCSRSCANTRVHSEETKLKVSATLKNKPKKQKQFKICKKCNKEFIPNSNKSFLCSKKCRIEYCKDKYDFSSFGRDGGIKSRKNNFIVKQQSIDDLNIKTFIYVLLDENDKVRYVGKSSQPHNRLKSHIKECKNKRTHKEKWINSMLENNLKPTVEVVDEVLFSEWQFWEIFYIQLYKSWGFTLVNGTSGGEGSDGFKGKKHTEETKSLLRFKNKKSFI